MTPTPEQKAIITEARTSTINLMCNAYAGCSKTTTLTMIAEALEATGGLALAFNVKIKKELEARFPKSFDVLTLNGLGHRAWGKAIGKRLLLENKKLGQIITEESRGYHTTPDDWGDIRKLVSLAQAAGIVPSRYPHRPLRPDTVESWAELAEENWIEPKEQTIVLARKVLEESVRQAFEGRITYDDQIYCSAMLGGVFPRYPLVMVDEAQDLSPLNHIQVKRSAADRLIVVGDIKQAIYGFRGADSNSMESLRCLRSEWKDLPLTTTFRCPRVVVARQQDHAPGFTAFEKNKDGRVLNAVHKTPRAGEEKFGTEEGTWSWSDVEALAQGEVAILCRNNAPLLSMAFKLLRQRVGVKMLGRDIGKGLVQLSKKVLPSDAMSMEDCVKVVGVWKDQQIAIAQANGDEHKIVGLTDRAECLLAVLEYSTNAGDLRKKLDDIFSREHGTVTLATGHKAKGLEWQTVIHLDPWRVPSNFAQKAAKRGDGRQLEQEKNLRYVIETRAQEILILANLENFV